MLIHDKQSMAMKNFRPSNYEKDLNGQALMDDKLGEFIISSYVGQKPCRISAYAQLGEYDVPIG